MANGTNNLDRTLLSETQSQKATGVNTADSEIDAAITQAVTIELMVGNTNYTILDSDLLRAAVLIADEAGATPIAANFNFMWNAQDRGIVSFYNATAYLATCKAATGDTDTVILPPGGYATFLITAARSIALQTSLRQVKQACRVSTTANITISSDLNAGDTIDGVTLVAGDRVLVKDQTTKSQNGIYIAGASPARAMDWDADGDIPQAVLVPVAEGTAGADKVWMLQTDTWPIVVGTTNIDFVQFGGGGGGSSASPGHPAPVRAATTASITIASDLNAGDTIDGVTLAAGDRVLVKNQSTASQNGIYVAGPSPARAADFDTDLTEVISGAHVVVTEGTVNQGKMFVLSTTGAITTGSTNLAFKEIATYKPDFACGFYFSGTPDTNANIWTFIMPWAVDFANEFAGSYGHCGTNPSGTTDFDVQRNGSSIGTVSVSSGGVFTFTTTGGAESFTAGQRISIISPANLNGMANISMTFFGSKVL